MVHVFSQKILSISETYAFSWFMISSARAFVHVYVSFAGAEHVCAYVRACVFQNWQPPSPPFPSSFSRFCCLFTLQNNKRVVYGMV